MEDEAGAKRHRYRYEYSTVFGYEFDEFEADDDEEADRIFWSDHTPGLTCLYLVSKFTDLTRDEQGDGGADEGGEGRPRGGGEEADGRRGLLERLRFWKRG